MFILRFSKALMVASIALFFTIICIDNILDYPANWPYVVHVLSMDTTFKDSTLLWRSVTVPAWQHFVYQCIIVWEGLTALVCWWGALTLMRHLNNAVEFHRAKPISIAGLTMGFLLYMVGFITIGGEWFNMWQSQNWNALTTAGMFVGFVMFVLVYLSMDNDM